jgi:hypothetical protein
MKNATTTNNTPAAGLKVKTRIKAGVGGGCSSICGS